MNPAYYCFNTPVLLEAVEQITTGAGTVLLVDDEAMVLEVGAEMIRSLGYTVLTASSGSEAVHRYQKERGGIDVVILDMIMPGMSGAQVFQRLMELDNPLVRLELVSDVLSRTGITT